jgi:hypothetical protein
MEVVCIQAFGMCQVGDVRDFPDDAEFSDLYFVPLDFDADHIPASLEGITLRHPDGEEFDPGPVVSTRSDTPDENEERALTGAGKTTARKPSGKAKSAAKDDEEKNEG